MWRTLEYIIDNPQPQLQIAINTNLGTDKKLIDKLINTINKLEDKVDRIDVYTSVESSGEYAEYAAAEIQRLHNDHIEYEHLHKVAIKTENPIQTFAISFFGRVQLHSRRLKCIIDDFYCTIGCLWYPLVVSNCSRPSSMGSLSSQYNLPADNCQTVILFPIQVTKS